MTDKDAMKLALDALETEVSIDWTNDDEFNASAEKMHEAIAALKARLAQEKALQTLHNENERLGLYRDAYTEQEPVGYVYSESGVKSAAIQRNLPNGTPLYTHPPQRTEPIQSLQCFHCQVTIETLNDKVMQLMAQRTWVGLTDDEIALINADYPHPQGFARAIEAKLKEKNT